MERGTHILVLAYPVQGHINPMLQFSKRLASKGPRVTFVLTSIMSKSILQTVKAAGSSVNFETISDGSEDVDLKTESIDAQLERIELVVSQNLAKFIERQKSSKHPPKILVYDSVLPWALNLARKLGVDGAPFFTQSCAVNAIYHHAIRGTFGRIPVEGPLISLPSMPSLGISDMPSFLCGTHSYPALLKLVLNQFSNLQEVNWLLYNTFDKLEHEPPNKMGPFCIASKGPKVTLVTGTMSTGHKSMQAQARSVAIEPISDGSDEAKSLRNWDHDRFKAMVSESLAKFIEKLGKSSKYPPKCLVYDSVMPWAIDVARQYGLTGAAFFTQSCAVKAIYYHAHVGSILRMPLEGPTVSLPSLPLLGINDLPSFLCDTGSYPAFLTLVLNQFSNIQEANWILCNTFDMLEDEILTWMASQWPVKTIGPAIPSVYLDKRLEDDKEYGLNLFKPDVDACMKWLDTKETGSVIYASFGSLAALGEEQMEEVAWGLKNSNCYFLWVVRESEEKKLPSNFLQETAEKGLVVSWCPQLEVLAHKAVGCFMTHCGWNSTLEALSLGVPLVAMPQWTDQTTNAKFIVDVWKVGVRIKLDEKGIATKEEIEMCIKEVMEGERGKEMKKNSMRWKELAKEAVDEGGSSDKNIVEFVAKLAHS